MERRNSRQNHNDRALFPVVKYFVGRPLRDSDPKSGGKDYKLGADYKLSIGAKIPIFPVCAQNIGVQDPAYSNRLVPLSSILIPGMLALVVESFP